MCQRVTSHKVMASGKGGGDGVSEVSTCEEHRNLPNGQLDIRDPRTGEWITLRPPMDNTL